MRASLAVWAILLVRSCGPANSLDQADRFYRTGRYPDAFKSYRDLATDGDAKVRVKAMIGAGRAANRLHDVSQARRFLAGAVAEAEIPGVSEDAYFEYAERLRADGEVASAQQFYYRAAAGAERNRNKTHPYQAAINAIMTLRSQR